MIILVEVELKLNLTNLYCEMKRIPKQEETIALKLLQERVPNCTRVVKTLVLQNTPFHPVADVSLGLRNL